MVPLEPLSHVQQAALGYCLPACAQMALAQLGIATTQAELAQVLGTRAGVGTPFPRVERLAQWGVRELPFIRCNSLLRTNTGYER